MLPCASRILSRVAAKRASSSFVRAMSTEIKTIAEHDEYDEKVARHRNIMNLGDLVPRKDFEISYVAPNASVVGAVDLVDWNTVWYGAVLRGDRNSIKVGAYSSIGDKTVITTVNSLESGFPAKVVIGDFTVIEAGCTLTSCMIGNKCRIGMGSTVCEGSVMEKESILLPGSVLTTGSLVPSGEIWGGNPAAFVENIPSDDIQLFEIEAMRISQLSRWHLDEFNPYNMAFTHAEELKEKGINV